MLFSEPKIPQFVLDVYVDLTLKRFSALQRAENSSMHRAAEAGDERQRFSALQRAENSSMVKICGRIVLLPGFSALQRAENSSM